MNLTRRIFEERKAVILPLVIGLAVNLAALLLAVLPLAQIVSSARMTAADSSVELAVARRLDRQAHDARASKERADEQLKTFYSTVLPVDLATAQKTTNLWLSETARETGLTFKGSHFEYEEVRNSRLTRAFARVTLAGPYPSLRRFLYSVETAKEFIVIERVELAQSGGQPSANGALEILLIVSTYFEAPAGS